MAVLLVLGGAVAVWWSWFATYHYAVVEEGVLYRDGNRGMREFRTALRHAKPRTVVCLVETQEIESPELPQFLQEKELCARQGIRFVHIPMSRTALPEDRDVRRFLEILADPSSHPLLVHCAQGVRRTGMMVAAYQQAVLGYDDEQAKSAILAFGHSDRSIAEVRRFIDLYEPGKPFLPTEERQTEGGGAAPAAGGAEPPEDGLGGEGPGVEPAGVEPAGVEPVGGVAPGYLPQGGARRSYLGGDEAKAESLDP